MFSDRMPKALRFVLITLALAGTYLLLQHFWLGVAELGSGWQTRLDWSSTAKDAAEVAARSDVISIPKATDPDHVRDNRAAADLVLTPDDLKALDAGFPPPKGATPLEML